MRSPVVIVAMAAAALAACSRDRNPAAPSPEPSIQLEPSPDTLLAGASTVLTAVVRDTAGRVDRTARVSWSSTDTTLLVVDAVGHVTSRLRAPVSIDSAEIVATAGALVARHRFVVVPEVRRVSLRPVTTLRTVGRSTR